ncbi:hypothetical protein LC609_29065 [Nostoc sp. XA013]|nr:hypothetical protein [Nostoc sp. XA013]
MGTLKNDLGAKSNFPTGQLNERLRTLWWRSPLPQIPFFVLAARREDN